MVAERVGKISADAAARLMDEEHVSTEEAGALIGCDRRQVKRYLDEGYLRGFRGPKRGSRIRVYTDSIVEFRRQYCIGEDGERRERGHL